MKKRKTLRPIGLLVVLGLSFAAAITGVEAKKKTKSPEERSRLARIYVHYSEPPFPYEPGDAIEIRVRTVWDREQMERHIREKVAKKGKNVVILTRSYMELDDEIRDVVVPGRRGEPHHMTQVPTSSANVAGHLGFRADPPPGIECERVYPFGFKQVWSATTNTLDQLGWRVAHQDQESRYLVTAPMPAASVTMQCARSASISRPAVFSIYVNTYDDRTMVHLDTSFLDPETAEPTECRSIGVYEKAFFERLDGLTGPGGESPE